MSAATLLMAKKRGPGRPKSATKRETIIALKGNPEFKTWLSDFAEFCDLAQADIIGQALKSYAEIRGFRAPPNR